MNQRLEDLYLAREEIKAVLRKYGVGLSHDYEELLLETNEKWGDGIRWEAERGEETIQQAKLTSALYDLKAGRSPRASMPTSGGGWEYREVTRPEVEAEIERLKNLYS